MSWENPRTTSRRTTKNNNHKLPHSVSQHLSLSLPGHLCWRSTADTPDHTGHHSTRGGNHEAHPQVLIKKGLCEVYQIAPWRKVRVHNLADSLVHEGPALGPFLSGGDVQFVWQMVHLYLISISLRTHPRASGAPRRRCFNVSMVSMLLIKLLFLWSCYQKVS